MWNQRIHLSGTQCKRMRTVYLFYLSIFQLVVSTHGWPMGNWTQKTINILECDNREFDLATGENKTQWRYTYQLFRCLTNPFPFSVGLLRALDRATNLTQSDYCDLASWPWAWVSYFCAAHGRIFFLTQQPFHKSKVLGMPQPQLAACWCINKHSWKCGTLRVKSAPP